MASKAIINMLSGKWQKDPTEEEIKAWNNGTNDIFVGNIKYTKEELDRLKKKSQKTLSKSNTIKSNSSSKMDKNSKQLNKNTNNKIEKNKIYKFHDISKIAVLDTETTWKDEVMSIGIVIADVETKREIRSEYYIISPEYESGGMFSNTLFDTPKKKTKVLSREEAIEGIESVLDEEAVSTIFAYNASFDYRHLPELASYTWVDIMKIAAYKQYNRAITDDMECCLSGRLKRGYGVEQILGMLKPRYRETHNAYFDAIDELEIVKLLELDIDVYENAILN